MRRRTLLLAAFLAGLLTSKPTVDYVQALVGRLIAARRLKDTSSAERIAGQLQALGVTLRDTPHGIYWARA